MTGIDCDSFDSLLVKFGLMFDGHTPFDESGMIVKFEYVSSSVSRLPRSCVSFLDMHQGPVECFVACLWTYLY